MKIMLLSDCNSVHTIKWATALSANNLEVIVFSLGALNVEDYQNTKVKIVDFSAKVTREGAMKKLGYLKALPFLKQTITKESPDIVHAHYASSYGLLGALAGFSPFVLSVWGSDIFDFPRVSFLHRWIIQYNLKKADKILSTSHVMAKETSHYTNKPIEVTPFGIDMQKFKPEISDGLFGSNDIVVGTVKTLEYKYGIEYLIRAFKIVKDRQPELPLKLLIVGGGSLEQELKGLCQQLKIENITIFTGDVPYSQVPKYHNLLSVSVSVSVSESESFGVAIIEASACEKPVVVSNVGGLPEVVEDGVTGFVVPSQNPEKTAQAIEKLIVDKELKVQMGKAGRARVARLYDWNNNVAQMIKIYEDLLR